MKISEILHRDAVVESLGAVTKREVLFELVEPLSRLHAELDQDRTVNILLEREKLGSTGVGEGIAIPHGKTPGLNEVIVSFGRSVQGVDFDALDGKPVHLFFLLMAPEGCAGSHLKALAKISRMLKDVPFRNRLMEARSAAELYRAIADQDDLC
ncbi:MAG: PTS system fructose-specific EIIABC component [Syntrophaceae bacterium PtaU1.Bin231]|nr:MAG: PTS system fructose-specific EIIABC component [Syntrophaceae bacterium PtaU1.Bin231]HOG17704.1 PTS sugar transporter subunit IIA [Syntrophales bacterium]